jgi:hypothetical protein
LQLFRLLLLTVSAGDLKGHRYPIRYSVLLHRHSSKIGKSAQ